ncbi:MAG: ADP-ribosylglycohydrolase family protein [Burkholderiaceae bacterium]
MNASAIPVPPAAPATEPLAHQERACLLLGALGDALGAPLEYLRIEEIRTAYGPRGLREPTRFNGRVGSITDDTQMMLFTAEGLLDAIGQHAGPGEPAYDAAVGAAYLRWLASQGLGDAGTTIGSPRGLLALAELRVQRAPSLTCLDALEAMRAPGQAAINTRMGNVAAGRAAPVGVLFGALAAADARTEADVLARCHSLAGRLARLTHGHPTASHSAGAFATLIAALLAGHAWDGALARVDELLAPHADAAPVRAAIARAAEASAAGDPTSDPTARLGEGWDAHEALAIAIHIARDANDPAEALLRAVNHSGDSDGCGLMTGCLIGASRGLAGVPSIWLAQLELASVIGDHAERLWAAARTLNRSPMSEAIATGA